jgi:hypothetical protein
MDEAPQDWYFSFGIDSPNKDKYVKINGTSESARLQMQARFGKSYAMQYDATVGPERVAKWNWTELEMPDEVDNGWVTDVRKKVDDSWVEYLQDCDQSDVLPTVVEFAVYLLYMRGWEDRDQAGAKSDG